MDKQIRKNFSFAFIAQGISLIVSCVTNLVLPKILGPEDFSYWQLFIFYSTYIPCLAIGINDGVYLRFGGDTRDSLNKESIKNQYLFGIIYQTIIAIIIGVVSLYVINDIRRKIVIILTLFYYLIYTCHNFLGYVFQAINETNQYSKSIILNKTIYLCVQIILMIIGYADVFILIPFYIAAMAGALIYLIVHIHPLLKNTRFCFDNGKSEAWLSIKTGISLMISNLCAMLVTGVGRQIIDMKWGIQAFGKVSFSLTLINFALTFISQIGMVLFPALRRLRKEELTNLYLKLTIGMSLLLPIIYLLYLPGQMLLNKWLPNYSDSIRYLAVILPICYFDCKMNMIANTFFKVLSKQVQLLKINLISIIFCIVWGTISAYFLQNMMLVIIGMVLSILFRSVFADLILSKEMGVKTLKYELFDICLALLFMYVANYANEMLAFIILLSLYIIRLILLRKHISINNHRIMILV